MTDEINGPFKSYLDHSVSQEYNRRDLVLAICILTSIRMLQYRHRDRSLRKWNLSFIILDLSSRTIGRAMTTNQQQNPHLEDVYGSRMVLRTDTRDANRASQYLLSTCKSDFWNLMPVRRISGFCSQWHLHPENYIYISSQCIYSEDGSDDIQEDTEVLLLRSSSVSWGRGCPTTLARIVYHLDYNHHIISFDLPAAATYYHTVMSFIICLGVRLLSHQAFVM